MLAKDRCRSMELRTNSCALKETSAHAPGSLWDRILVLSCGKNSYMDMPINQQLKFQYCNVDLFNLVLETEEEVWP